jgi:DNA-binding protein HU-beta
MNKELSIMNKSELIVAVSDATGMKQSDVSDVVNSTFDTITARLAETGLVKISGFGTFFVHDKKGRIARNPRTGEAVTVPEKRVPKFKASRVLKEAM